ncbi:type VII secretion protein EccE [Nocardia huaxiensis]|uniref:type VII secretion protein EccE n=1 Tax=Nocardia huaxiensis TaxID=2755382 RepID=UPI001E3CCD83|nr:type VII secretion protein EccE [Nocardia huaxiensis]UFS95432.1 type VII secretion protein EccE [Nocardia huaxiensis]
MSDDTRDPENDSGAGENGAPNTPENENSVNSSLRDTEFWLFTDLPLHVLIPLGLFAALAAWTAVALDLSPIWSAVIGTAVFAVGAVPVRRRRPRGPAAMLADRITLAVRRWRARGATESETEPFDVPLPEGGVYGMHWNGGLLVTMLRIDPPPDTLTLLRPGSISTDQLLPLDEIAGCLGQFDITLDSVDVIALGARTSDAGPLGRLYDQIVGPLPAIAHRTVWLVLRLDPLANATAVDNRGGGAVGTLRTAMIATRRVANRLAAHDISASVLSASEMNAALCRLTRGVPVTDFVETPEALVHEGIHLASYDMDSAHIDSGGFADIWATPSLCTTITVRLRPARDRVLGGQPGDAVTVHAMVRFDTATAPSEPPVSGLRPLTGQQLTALLDCLPAQPIHRRDDGYRGPRDALLGITVPTAGCGQLIGADDAGQGIAVPLIGDGTRHVEVVGRLGLAQQVILRALALGARAIVHTDRPEQWQAMVLRVDMPQALSLAPRTAGATAHTPPPTPQPSAVFPTTTVVVFDGIEPTLLAGGATVVHVRAPEEPPTDSDPDVVLTQDPAHPTRITVRTPSTEVTVTMVTTPDEMGYIGESLSATR